MGGVGRQLYFSILLNKINDDEKKIMMKSDARVRFPQWELYASCVTTLGKCFFT